MSHLRSKRRLRRGPAAALLTHVAGQAGRLAGRLSLPLLLSLLLAVQIAGSIGHRGTRDLAADPSGLGAAIGQAVVLCLHDNPDGPVPAIPGDCDHCVLCHVLAGGALVPAGARLPHPAPIVARLARQGLPEPAPRQRLACGASPRGPPTLV